MLPNVYTVNVKLQMRGRNTPEKKLWKFSWYNHTIL